MRDYGRVYSSFWTSDDIRDLSDDGKLLALYLLSGPHQTIAGVCRLPDGYVSEDLGWGSERVTKGFHELFRKGFATRCNRSKWVWMRNFLAWNTPENPNQWKAARKVMESVPHGCSWKPSFIAIFEDFAAGKTPDFGNPSETLPEPLPEPLPTQEQDQDQDQEQEGEREREGKPSPQTTSRKSKSRKASKPSRTVPPEFVPDLAYAAELAPDMDGPAEFEKFRIWEFKTPHGDWNLAWKRWVREGIDRGKYTRKVNGSASPAPARDWTGITQDGGPPIWR